MDRHFFDSTLIYLNGPPSVGKDTIGLALHHDFHCTIHRFKEQLITLVLEVYNVSRAEFLELYKNKESSTPLLGGRSPRQALIHMSEEVIKPAFGDAYFGQATARSIDLEDIKEGGIVMTDCGFATEVNEVVKAYPDRKHILVRLGRAGCNFKLDSRSYIKDNEFLGNHTLDVHCLNNPTIAAGQVLTAINELRMGTRNAETY